MSQVSAREKRIQLRAQLAQPEITFAPSCGDAITARLIESLGIPAVHLSGSSVHRQAGFADAGILTMTEMVAALALVCSAVDIPVIGDADTGFGGIPNVVRTVRQYEQAGAAAIHIEDQLTPKRPPVAGEQHDTITRSEMVSKIRAAVDAREDQGLMIIARSEVKGDPDEVRERLVACVDAGADAVWIAWQGPEELQRLRAAVSCPLVGVLPSKLTLHEYGSLGANAALLPTWLEAVATHAKQSLLTSYLATGSPDAYVSNLDGIEESRAFVQQQGARELRHLEEQYG